MISIESTNILLISPGAWGENFVSKHHYAISLAKSGHQVYFLNPPTSVNFNISISSYDNLLIVDYKPLFRGIRILPPFLSAWLTLIEIRRLEKKIRTNFDVIWNFETSRFFNLAKISPETGKISHIVDYTENFNLKLASKTADLCLGTSDFINAEQRKFNQHVYKIHHGVSPTYVKGQEIRLEEKFSIKVGYVGNLSIRYIDWETIFTVCKQHVEVGFYFIGPEGKNNLGNSVISNPYFHKVRRLHNTFFLGAQPAEKIPAYLNYFDILWMVYKAEEYKAQLANPHKLMEYLASGKVIVASYTDEYKDKPGLLEMATDKQHLISLFKNVVQHLDHYNSQEKANRRTAFAQANLYEKHLDKILNLLEKHA